VLPVAVVATVLTEAEGPLGELEVKGRAQALMEHFEAKGAKLYVPRGDRDYAIAVGLRMLSLRHLVEESAEGLFAARAEERPVLAYYANSIAHLR
jgi:glycerol-3-phosphate O-acyltransferase